MADSFLDKARKIGFNRALTWNSRKFVVQTEVYGRERLFVRTTILEQGIVRISVSRECTNCTDDLERVKATAEAQHNAYLDRVKLGEVD